MKKWVLTGLLIIFITYACERDDLCLDAHTPKAVTVFKNNITGEKMAVDSLVVLNMQGDTLIPLFKTDSIGIPLQISAGETRLKFIFKHAQVQNADEVIFQYQREPYFAGKSCGYVMHYKQVRVQAVPDGNNWIQQINVLIPEITQDTVAHVEVLY